MEYQSIEYLLQKYCHAETTAEETAEVEAWLQVDEHNHALLEQYARLQFSVDYCLIQENSETKNAYQRVLKKITPKKRNWLQIYQQIAAVLLFPLLIGASLLLLDTTSDTPPTWTHAYATPGMRTEVQLPDGSKVILNSESELIYPSRFDKKNREVELKGEAYFDVVKDPSQKFVVKTPQSTFVEVYGTQFNLDAYPNNKEIIATLVNGHIGFFYKKEQQYVKVNLYPHQKVIYTSPQKISVQQTPTTSEISWKDGRLIFQNTSMSDILKMLSRRFNVHFNVKNPAIYEYAFTGSFTTQRLESVLEYFKRSSKISWRYSSLDNPNATQVIEIY